MISSTGLTDETIFISVDSDGNGSYDDFVHLAAPDTYSIYNSGSS